MDHELVVAQLLDIGPRRDLRAGRDQRLHLGQVLGCLARARPGVEDEPHGDAATDRRHQRVADVVVLELVDGHPQLVACARGVDEGDHRRLQVAREPVVRLGAQRLGEDPGVAS